MNAAELLTARQLSEQYNWPYGGIQSLLFNREKNGLNRATIKIGRKLLINTHKFEEWLNAHYEAQEESADKKICNVVSNSQVINDA